MTGAAGFIGSHLCERLLSEHWIVTGIDSLAATYETGTRRASMERLQENRAFRFIEGDLLHIDVTDLVRDVDVVFHLAARPGVRSSWEDFQWALDANVMATKRVLYGLVRSESKARLVFASSSSVYGSTSNFPTTEGELLRPISPYGVTKASAEQLISAYATQFGVDSVILRYFTVYGPRQRPDMAFSKWITSALSGRPLTVFGSGDAVRDFTYVSDVVEATLRAARARTDTYNVAGGSPITVTDAIELMAELVGRDVEVRHVSTSAGDPERTWGDTSLIQTEMGWKPEVDIRSGLGEQVLSMMGG